MKTKKFFEFIWEILPMAFFVGSITMSFIQSPWYLLGLVGIPIWSVVYFHFEYKKLKKMTPEQRADELISLKTEYSLAKANLRFNSAVIILIKNRKADLLEKKDFDEIKKECLGE